MSLENELGEMLREKIFNSKDGCYSKFDVDNNFEKVTLNDLNKLNLCMTKEKLNDLFFYRNQDDWSDTEMENFILENKERLQIFYNKISKCFVAWLWLNDGCLLVGEKDNFVINYDCKKNYN